jgi:type IV secretory pathway VirD2 relaxase
MKEVKAMSIFRRWQNNRDKERAAYQQQLRNERVAEAIKVLEEEGTSQEAMGAVIVILAKEQAANKNMAWVRKARAILEPLYASIFKRRTNNGKRKNNTQIAEVATPRGTGNLQVVKERPPAKKQIDI